MTDDTTAIERAFQLAASGGCRSLTDIRKSLKEEGFSLRTIEGPTLTRQLRVIITKARSALPT